MPGVTRCAASWSGAAELRRARAWSSSSSAAVRTEENRCVPNDPQTRPRRQRTPAPACSQDTPLYYRPGPHRSLSPFFCRSAPEPGTAQYSYQLNESRWGLCVGPRGASTRMRGPQESSGDKVKSWRGAPAAPPPPRRPARALYPQALRGAQVGVPRRRLHVRGLPHLPPLPSRAVSRGLAVYLARHCRRHCQWGFKAEGR